MRIEHVAIWTGDLDRLREFYTKYFDGSAGPRYSNAAKQFESYFLEFASGARLELMYHPAARHWSSRQDDPRGYAHMAFSVGSEADVDRLTARLEGDGYPVLDGPRRTGDGYYESVVLDPDGNRVEITAS